jgi:UDP-glucuronate 4-epimerase
MTDHYHTAAQTGSPATDGVILVTGAAGFIGYHLCDRLLRDGRTVVGVDNLNDYYDVTLKKARLARLEGRPWFTFHKIDLTDRTATESLFREHRFSAVVHLAAQAGVRYSLEHPHAYIASNITGFLNVLEGCRHSSVKHLVYASSSSVYGANTRMPFSVRHSVDHPVSLYAATKKAGELMAHTYAALYHLPVTGLRFFTVYGPWGRPDMALFIFTKAILENRPIYVYNKGEMQRDFTYIDDVIEGVVRIIPRVPAPDPAWNGSYPDPATSFAPARLYNIGNNRPVRLKDFIEALEQALGKKAVKHLLPLQPGDVPATWADVSDLERDIGFAPATPVTDGVARFVTWYREYYRV